MTASGLASRPIEPAMRLSLFTIRLMSQLGNASRGDALMSHSSNIVRQLLSAVLGGSPSPKRRRVRHLTPTVDGLEDRVVLSHIGGFHHHHAHHAASVQTAQTSTTTASDSLETTAGTTSMTTSTALSTARQTLLDDIQTI